MNNDHLANVLSSITNYEKLGKKELVTLDNNKVIRAVLTLLQKEGYLGETEVVKDAKGDYLKINLLTRVNQARGDLRLLLERSGQLRELVVPLPDPPETPEKTD